MPTLPLPIGAGIYGGDLPVVDESDVEAILPAFLKTTDPSPVKDAIIAALTIMMQTYQEDSEEAVALNDILRSVDYPLYGLGEDRGTPKQQDQSDKEYRNVILRIQNDVTPAAIMAAVNVILAPHTNVLAQYLESIQDRWYISDGSHPWHSYVWDNTSSMAPTYPNRLYEDDASKNLGYFRPQSNPGGARVFSDMTGRFFWIRIPDLSNIDTFGAFSNSDVIESRFYVGGLGVGSELRSIPSTSVFNFNTIYSVVTRLKGSSIRFTLYMDPKLT